MGLTPEQMQMMQQMTGNPYSLPTSLGVMTSDNHIMNDQQPIIVVDNRTSSGLNVQSGSTGLTVEKPINHQITLNLDRNCLYGDPTAVQPPSTVIGSPTALQGMRPSARRGLEDIMSKYHVRISIRKSIGAVEEDVDTIACVEMDLQGNYDGVEMARIKVLQLLDTLVSFTYKFINVLVFLISNNCTEWIGCYRR